VVNEPAIDHAVSQSAEGGLSYYEQFSQTGRCTSTKAPVIVGWNDTNKQAIIWQPPCNTWSCPECAPVLRARQAIRAYLGAVQIQESGQDVFFLTLTPHERLTADQSWWVLPRAWNKLRRRASREEPDGLYFMIPEHHKSGKAHAHAITSWTMPERWWKDNGRSCGFGFEADHQVARSGPGAGAYALKYLLKQVTGRAWKKGKRRIMASHTWPAVPELPAALDWQFEAIPRGQSIQYTYALYQESGFDVRLLDRGQRLDQLETIFGQICTEAENEREQA
jgi:hypothetical protein